MRLSASLLKEDELSWRLSRIVDSNRNENSWSSRKAASLQSSASSGLSGVNSSSSSGWNSTVLRFRRSFLDSELGGFIDWLSFESVTMVLLVVFMFWYLDLDLLNYILCSNICGVIQRKSEGSSPHFCFWWPRMNNLLRTGLRVNTRTVSTGRSHHAKFLKQARLLFTHVSRYNNYCRTVSSVTQERFIVRIVWYSSTHTRYMFRRSL